MLIKIVCEKCKSRMRCNPFGVFFCDNCGKEESDMKLWNLIHWGDKIIDDKYNESKPITGEDLK